MRVWISTLSLVLLSLLFAGQTYSQSPVTGVNEIDIYSVSPQNLRTRTDDVYGALEIVASKFEPTAVALLLPLHRRDHGYVGFNYKVGAAEAREYSIADTPFEPSESGRAVLELGPHHFVIVGSVAQKAAYLHLWWDESGPFPDRVQTLVYSAREVPKLKDVPGIVRAYPYPKANGDSHYLLTSYDQQGVVIVEMDTAMLEVVRTHRLEMPRCVDNGVFRDAIAVPRANESVLVISYTVKPFIGETAGVQLDPTWSREWEEVSCFDDVYRVKDAIPLPDGRVALAGVSGKSIKFNETGTRLASGELQYWVKLSGNTRLTADIQRWTASGPRALVYRGPMLSFNIHSRELAAAYQSERAELGLYVFSFRGGLLDTYSLETPELESTVLTALTSLPTGHGFLAATHGKMRNGPLPPGIRQSIAEVQLGNQLLSITPSGRKTRPHETYLDQGLAVKNGMLGVR
jgi:hypothetical protein